MLKQLLSFTVLCVLITFAVCSSKPDYAATPFFSEEAFSRIEAGMSEDEVRDLAGYPVSRFGPVKISEDSSKTKTYWEYTVPSSCKEPLHFRGYSVTFSSDGIVTEVVVHDSTWEMHEGVQDSIEAVQRCRREIGDIIFKGFDDKTDTIKSSEPGVFVILLDIDCRMETCSINPGPDWFVSESPAMLESGKTAGIQHVYIGEHPDPYRELVDLQKKDEKTGFYLAAEPGLGLTVWELDGLMLICKNGTIWSVPGSAALEHRREREDDQKWLLNRLLKE